MSALDPAQRRRLLSLARRSIAGALAGDESTAPPADAIDATLPTGAGCFVSLHQRDGDLRGCVGTLTGEGPLAAQIWRIARASAFDDPRFPPLAAGELERCDIEISVLGPLVRCGADEVRVGRDGLVVSRGRERGVLLPQVPVQAGWSREQFLAGTCRKARLPDDAWTDPATQLQRFEAQVFDEGELPGRPE